MLPDPGLKPAYDKVEWVYVYRDFTGSDADRAAERVSIRCGVTSWPHLLLMDPATLEITGEAGQTVDTFLASVDRARAGKGTGGLEAWKKAEKNAEILHSAPTVEKAAALLDETDIVVRTLALRHLVKEAPGRIADRAAELLAVPNDPFRYEVCDALAAAKAGGAARALEAVLAEPKDSLNPNVLRMKAALALGLCGDEDSVAVLAPFAKSGYVRNALTGTCVDALAAIATRLPETRNAVREVLLDAFPEPGGGDEARMSAFLAARIRDALNKVTGKDVPFPEKYDAEARERLKKAW